MDAATPELDSGLRGRAWAALWCAAALGAMASVAVFAALDYPVALLAALPIAAIAGLLILAHTPTALCVIAFLIVPLGALGVEIASVTVYLPEVLILLLFAKEFFLFVTRNEPLNPLIPRGRLMAYAGVGLICLPLALHYGTPLIPALQDARQFLEFVLLYLLVMQRVKSRALIRSILSAYVAGVVLIAAHGILERLTGIGIPATRLVSDLVYHSGVRSGSFYGPTTLGAIMVLGIGAALALILSSRSRLEKLVFSGACVVMLVADVFTNTRASWLALALVLAFIFVSVRKRPALVIASVTTCMVFGAILGPVIYNRMATLEVSKKERSLLERVQYYTAAWHIFRSHPALGLGWGGYYDIKEILVNGRYVKTKPPALPAHMKPEQPTVHSAYLQILVKTGLAGLVSFLALLTHWGLWILRERRARPRDELDHNLYIGLTAALIGYLFHATGENFFQWPVMAQTFWMFLALSTIMAAALVRNGRLDAGAANAEAPALAPDEPGA